MMGRFKPGSSRGFEGRDRNRGNRSGGRFGGRNEGRGFGRDRGNRKPAEFYDITCDKCGKESRVPFKPRGDKPVLCSDCFGKKGDSSRNFSSDNQSHGSSQGISKEQFNQLNSKLDKILKILESIEFEEGEEDEDDEDFEDEE